MEYTAEEIAERKRQHEASKDRPLKMTCSAMERLSMRLSRPRPKHYPEIVKCRGWAYLYWHINWSWYLGRYEWRANDTRNTT